MNFLKKGLPMCLLVILTASSATAAVEFDSDSYSVNYGEELVMGFSDAPVNSVTYEIDLCGERLTTRKSKLGTTGAFRIHIPKDVPCGLGQETVSIGPTSDTTTVNIESGVNIGNPNMGYYIVSRFGVVTDPNNPSKVRDFFLTNEPWYDDDSSNGFNEFPDHSPPDRPVEKGTFFLISEADGNLADKSDEGIYIAQYGNIIKPFSSSLGDHVLGRYTTARGGPSEGWFAGGPPAHISQSLNREFSGTYIEQYGTEKQTIGSVDGACHVSRDGAVYEWNGNCAPLHNDGTFEPQGEIIVASESSATFADPGDRPLSISSSTYFFVCRDHPSDPDWQGTRPSNSKVVKVQQKQSGNLVDEWKYYHCNTNNDWEEIECDPGQKVDRESGSLQCVEKNPVTVDVKFFDMSSVPRPSGAAGASEIIAGFKIESSEIQKYEDFMGEPLKRVDAECWMGDDDQRPSSESAAGTFRLNYKNIGSGDAWVLGKIPYRTGVNDQTYSCVWGFSEEPQFGGPGGTVVVNEGIYESTRNDPLRSVENARINVNYTETIQPEYVDLAKPSELDEGVDRSDLWLEYSSSDTRSYVTADSEDMFDFSNAFPYCTTPTSPASVLDEIICN